MDPRSGIPQPLYAPILRALFRFLMLRLGGIVVLGQENVPTSGPVLFCPNHISDSDPVAIYTTTPRRDIYYMAKEELFEIPILGPMMRIFGCFPVKRSSADRGAIRQALEILDAGNTLVLFPEGHLSETGNLDIIQPGAAMIALKSGAAVVPVGIARTNRILPYGHIWPSKSRLPVRVIYGKPISTADLPGKTGRAAIDALTTIIEHEIRALTNQEVTK